MSNYIVLVIIQDLNGPTKQILISLQVTKLTFLNIHYTDKSSLAAISNWCPSIHLFTSLYLVLKDGRNHIYFLYRSIIFVTLPLTLTEMHKLSLFCLSITIWSHVHTTLHLLHSTYIMFWWEYSIIVFFHPSRPSNSLLSSNSQYISSYLSSNAYTHLCTTTILQNKPRTQVCDNSWIKSSLIHCMGRKTLNHLNIIFNQSQDHNLHYIPITYH